MPSSRRSGPSSKRLSAVIVSTTSCHASRTSRSPNSGACAHRPHRAGCRSLFGNPVALPADASWPLVHPVLSAFAWCIEILAVATPLMLLRYRARTTG